MREALTLSHNLPDAAEPHKRLVRAMLLSANTLSYRRGIFWLFRHVWI